MDRMVWNEEPRLRLDAWPELAAALSPSARKTSSPGRFSGWQGLGRGVRGAQRSEEVTGMVNWSEVK